MTSLMFYHHKLMIDPHAIEARMTKRHAAQRGFSPKVVAKSQETNPFGPDGWTPDRLGSLAGKTRAYSSKAFLTSWVFVWHSTLGIRRCK